MPLSIVLNGKERTLPALEAASPVSELVRALDLKPDRIAVERNGMIVSRKRWEETKLAAGDRIEVVHFVGGGSR